VLTNSKTENAQKKNHRSCGAVTNEQSIFLRKGQKKDEEKYVVACLVNNSGVLAHKSLLYDGKKSEFYAFFGFNRVLTVFFLFDNQVHYQHFTNYKVQ
jgi:hypothetical protein